MRRPTIYLVDAFRDECDMYAEYLAVSGFAVSTFDSADVALERARAVAPDAIVTRIRQAKGVIDGIALTASLRADAATRNTGIVVITSSMLQGDHEAAVQAGCDAYLVLPTTPDDLVRTLGVVLRARAVEQVPPAGGRRAAPRNRKDIA